MVADSHHFGEEQNRIRIHVEVKRRIQIRIEVKSWIPIRIKVMRIRNLDHKYL